MRPNKGNKGNNERASQITEEQINISRAHF